jgi:hypothetical protein
MSLGSRVRSVSTASAMLVTAAALCVPRSFFGGQTARGHTDSSLPGPQATLAALCAVGSVMQHAVGHDLHTGSIAPAHKAEDTGEEAGDRSGE